MVYWRAKEGSGDRLQDYENPWSLAFPQRKEGLSAPYVNSWLKYKTEASGWPKHCDTQEQKEQYVEDFEAKQGIKLENIQKNPGRKQVAKSMLNS